MQAGQYQVAMNSPVPSPGPLIAADPRRRGRHLDGTGWVARSGQAQHDRAGASPIVVEDDHRPAVVDGHLCHRPAGQR
jgi:hypothetical protein